MDLIRRWQVSRAGRHVASRRENTGWGSSGAISYLLMSLQRDVNGPNSSASAQGNAKSRAAAYLHSPRGEASSALERSYFLALDRPTALRAESDCRAIRKSHNAQHIVTSLQRR